MASGRQYGQFGRRGYVSFSNIAFLPIAQLYFAPEIGEAGIFANIRCCAAGGGGTQVVLLRLAGSPIAAGITVCCFKPPLAVPGRQR